MNIAIVTLTNPFKKNSGGIESYVNNLSKALASQGNKVWVISTSSDSTESDRVIEIDGVRLYLVHHRTSKNIFEDSLKFLIRGRQIIYKIEEEEMIDFFLGQGGLSSPLIFSKLKNARKILTIHTLDTLERMAIKDYFETGHIKNLFFSLISFPILRCWRMITMQRAEALVFVSQSTFNDFNKHYRIKKPTRIICNASAKSITAKVNKELDFVYVGRLDKAKGLHLIIEALRGLKEKGIKMSIVFIGDGPWKSYLMKLARDYDVKDQAIFYGSMTNQEVLEVIKKSRFLLLPSRYESDPLVVHEALAMGTVPIITKIPALSSIVIDGENGFYIDEYDANKLSEVLVKAISLKSEEYSCMSSKASGTERHRDWGNVAQEYIEYFESLRNISHRNKIYRNTMQSS